MHRQFKPFYQFIEQAIRVLEIVLALLLIVGVVGAGAMMVASLYGMLSVTSSHNFQQFLDQGLLYLIGLEVAMMLIKRDPHLVVDILIFAIARKMIMTMTRGTDFFFGALAILILYFAKWYGLGNGRLPSRFLAAAWGSRRAGTRSRERAASDTTVPADSTIPPEHG
ncbi:hypothetical protein [Alicyclobacillus sp. ALC3]|uniref:hypothetical protein n=1 Tax=Alicyclobacillus sp. ALC3 TaxID=2796143 RepID=UPI002378624F|nr:hypothetical protein [Alicyclobacillus sp. ALC3]WDL95541.1 hypothetical protein JC200_14225 [Alicyclobacillus sp. ALC3]